MNGLKTGVIAGLVLAGSCTATAVADSTADFDNKYAHGAIHVRDSLDKGYVLAFGHINAWRFGRQVTSITNINSTATHLRLAEVVTETQPVARRLPQDTRRSDAHRRPRQPPRVVARRCRGCLQAAPRRAGGGRGSRPRCLAIATRSRRRRHELNLAVLRPRRSRRGLVCGRRDSNPHGFAATRT